MKKAAEKALAEEKKASNAAKNNPANTNNDVNPVTKSENTVKAKSVLDRTPEGSVVSDNFRNNRGKLPWPVEAGHVSIPFGPYSVEGLKGIISNSPGITIETAVGIPVKAIFDGEVSTVFNIEGSSAVLIRVGKFFISYSNLSAVTVTKGDKVKLGQVIGKAAENSDGNGEIQLVLMEEKTNLNPEQWLKRK